MILELTGVSFQWPGRKTFGLSVASFAVARGERVLLLGDSGSGKSTLLSLVCGTVLADTGHVAVDGVDLATLSGGARDRFRAEKIGIVFQQFNLLPFGTVADNILLPLYFAPERRTRAENARAQAARLCTQLGLPEDILSARAERLSVGQQQRVAVARALIGEPPLIVADEPTSALDAKAQKDFMDVLFRQLAAPNTALLMVSHDHRMAGHFDRVVHISEIAQLQEVTS